MNTHTCKDVTDEAVLGCLLGLAYPGICFDTLLHLLDAPSWNGKIAAAHEATL